MQSGKSIKPQGLASADTDAVILQVKTENGHVFLARTFIAG